MKSKRIEHNLLKPSAKNKFINWAKVLAKQCRYIGFGIVLVSLSLTTPACKSSKKAKAKAAEEARLAKEKEDQLKREAAEKQRLEAAEKAKKEPTRKIEGYFQSVASAGSVEAANQQIAEALNMFSTPDAPVLIIISRSGDVVDYDRPSTIRKYFDYLKDQKKTFNKVENIAYDENGKIKELILITK